MKVKVGNRMCVGVLLESDTLWLLTQMLHCKFNIPAYL